MGRQRTKCGHNYFFLQALRGWSRPLFVQQTYFIASERSYVDSLYFLIKIRKMLVCQLGRHKYGGQYASKYTAKKASLTFLSENVP